MGRSESVVYGFIRDYQSPLTEFGEDLRLSSNLKAIGALPSPLSFSLIHREMFTCPRKHNSYNETSSYVIHFGASYLGIEYEWKHWMQQFENLLNKMYWTQATVHMETDYSGNHIFQWTSPGEDHQPGELIQSTDLEWIREAV